MRPLRPTFVLVLTLVALLASWAIAQARDARDAVVRITSHGGSGTVIVTEPGRTLILSAAHVFVGQDQKKITIDAPWLKNHQEPDRQAPMKLLAAGNVEADDIALLEVQDGPWPHVCPVAPSGHRPSRDLWSCGYDEMRWPMVRDRATLTGRDDLHWYTRESPWHGRSGGGLIDLEKGVLIGVVQAYQTAWPGGPRTRGIYASHEAVLQFLARAQPRGQAQPAPGGGGDRPLRIEERRGEGPYVPEPGEAAPAPGGLEPSWRPSPAPSIPDWQQRSRPRPQSQAPARPAPAPPSPAPANPYPYFAPPGGCPGGQCPNCPR